MEFEVSVQVEEMVTVEYDPGVYDKESYRTPRVLWSREEQERTEREQRRNRESRGGGGRRASRVPVLGERSSTGRSKSESHLGDGGSAGT